MPREAQSSSTRAVKAAHLAENGRPELRRAGVQAVQGVPRMTAQTRPARSQRTTDRCTRRSRRAK
eukprot:3630349-Lingulodinium_polyedra.AAC.1